MSSVLEDKEAQWGDHVRRFNVTMEEPPEVYQISCVSWWGDITWRACILKSVSSMEKGFYSAAIDFGYNSSLGHFQQNLCIFRMQVTCICHNSRSNHFQEKSILWMLFANLVNIPSSVTFIGTEAFYGCSLLTSITVPIRLCTVATRPLATAKCADLWKQGRRAFSVSLHLWESKNMQSVVHTDKGDRMDTGERLLSPLHWAL